MVDIKGLSRSARVVAAILVASSTGQPAAGTPISYGSNYYDFVPAVGISWADASAAASATLFLGVNGHLATVTSAAENNFLVSGFDFTAFKDQLAIAWLGGLVSSSGIGTWAVGPEAGLAFSSGGTALPGQYANWAGVEPNNAPSAVEMQIGTLNWFGITQGKWADARNGLSSPCPEICDPIVGYFVEYEAPATVPLSPSIAQFVLGLAFFGWLVSRRRHSMSGN
jgi:hypothetical protein